MTREEFLAGWTLLLMQPWAWRFNQVGKNGMPTGDALGQLDLYFQKVRRADPNAWLEVARRFAEGEKWPSAQEIYQSLISVNSKYVRALPEPESGWAPMPGAVRDRLKKLGLLS